MRLFLVRHGITEWNQKRRLQGQTDVPLAPEGVEQARRVAARLASQPLDAVWSSDLSRARVTAEMIAQEHNLSVRTTPLLREAMMGDWEGLTEAEVRARGEGEAWSRYMQDSVANRPPGGETMEAIWDRVLAGLAEVRRAHSEGNIALVGHGGSMRAILCHALGAPMPSMRHIWLDNASLSLIDFGGRGWVKLMNDTTHLGLEADVWETRAAAQIDAA